ncbi:hypothetical protein [Pseudomonas helleri]|uniref:hypothetical protein n=1 Tax=Pseudomonas helleri TaxID=1608996 RepID=UPI0021C56D09|nr:hypothetical protein [Pseudomonas helleri]MCU1753956.1 hypothetical protein [Pseudomonas helleri]
MFNSTSSFKTLSVSFLLMASAAHADPHVAPGADWAKVVQAVLSVSSCQNRLVEADRAKCYKNNSAQACRDIPEGVQKENCIIEYSYNRVPQKTGMPARPPLVISPFKSDGQALNNTASMKATPQPVESAPDELDSTIKFLLHDQEQAPVVR